jgi:hypothetical protein
VARSIDGPITVAYGTCTSPSLQDAHHVLGQSGGSASESTRLVWVLPEDTEAGGCLSAWDSVGMLVGRSEPQLVQNNQKRRAEKRAGMSFECSQQTSGNGPLTFTLCVIQPPASRWGPPTGLTRLGRGLRESPY